jgi:hypothetical protein
LTTVTTRRLLSTSASIKRIRCGGVLPCGWALLNEGSWDYELIIGRINDDLNIAMSQYSTVNRFMQDKYKLDNVWVGIEMNPEPPGLGRLETLLVSVRK